MLRIPDLREAAVPKRWDRENALKKSAFCIEIMRYIPGWTETVKRQDVKTSRRDAKTAKRQNVKTPKRQNASRDRIARENASRVANHELVGR